LRQLIIKHSNLFPFQSIIDNNILVNIFELSHSNHPHIRVESNWILSNLFVDWNLVIHLLEKDVFTILYENLADECDEVLDQVIWSFKNLSVDNRSRSFFLSKISVFDQLLMIYWKNKKKTDYDLGKKIIFSLLILFSNIISFSSDIIKDE